MNTLKIPWTLKAKALNLASHIFVLIMTLSTPGYGSLNCLQTIERATKPKPIEMTFDRADHSGGHSSSPGIGGQITLRDTSGKVLVENALYLGHFGSNRTDGVIESNISVYDPQTETIINIDPSYLANRTEINALAANHSPISYQQRREFNCYPRSVLMALRQSEIDISADPRFFGFNEMSDEDQLKMLDDQINSGIDFDENGTFGTRKNLLLQHRAADDLLKSLNVNSRRTLRVNAIKDHLLAGRPIILTVKYIWEDLRPSVFRFGYRHLTPTNDGKSATIEDYLSRGNVLDMLFPFIGRNNAHIVVATGIVDLGQRGLHLVIRDPQYPNRADLMPLDSLARFLRVYGLVGGITPLLVDSL